MAALIIHSDGTDDYFILLSAESEIYTLKLFSCIDGRIDKPIRSKSYSDRKKAEEAYKRYYRKYCNITLSATCAICNTTEKFRLNAKETKTLKRYWCYGRQMGYLQNLFPRVPAWIRSGAIDQYSDGFCICPYCGGEED